jgi:hypothetical protein
MVLCVTEQDRIKIWQECCETKTVEEMAEFGSNKIDWRAEITPLLAVQAILGAYTSEALKEHTGLLLLYGDILREWTTGNTGKQEYCRGSTGERLCDADFPQLNDDVYCSVHLQYNRCCLVEEYPLSACFHWPKPIERIICNYMWICFCI